MSCKHIGKIVAAADMANLVAGGATAYADDIELCGGGFGPASRSMPTTGSSRPRRELLGTFCELRRIEMTRIRKSDLRETTDGMAIIIHGKSNKPPISRESLLMLLCRRFLFTGILPSLGL